MYFVNIVKVKLVVGVRIVQSTSVHQPVCTLGLVFRGSQFIYPPSVNTYNKGKYDGGQKVIRNYF